jgi:excisionase family DNA binding protein
MSTISFNDLPGAVTELLEKVSSIERLLKSKSEKPDQTEDGLLTISGAGELLDLSRNTMYKLAQNRAVPYIKKGKRLYFLKEELLTWVKTGKKKTEIELKEEAENSLITHNKNRRSL